MVVDIQADEKVQDLTSRYAWITAAEIVAIPVPGADLAAVFATWVKMIREIGTLYGYEVEAEDARRLAGDILKGALLTGCAWVGSTMVAGTLLKLVPGAGTLTAYLVDAVVAGAGAHKITAGVAVTAALYFKTGKAFAPKTFAKSVKKVLLDPELVLSVLATFAVGRAGTKPA